MEGTGTAAPPEGKKKKKKCKIAIDMLRNERLNIILSIYLANAFFLVVS